MVEAITLTIRSTARSYLEIIFHRKWLVIIPVIFGTLIAWAYSYTVTPMYKSQAVLEIVEKFRENPFISGISKSRPIASRMGSIVERVKSRSMIEEIIKELNLDENVKNRFEYQQLIGTIRGNVSVSSSRSNLLKISCSYPEPEACQRIVNLLTRRIIKENLELQEKETEVGIEWLNKEINIYKDRLEKADEKLQEFQEKYSELLPEELTNEIYSTLTWQSPYSGTTVNPPFQADLIRTNPFSLRYQNYSTRLVHQGLELKELQKKRTTILKQLAEEDEYILSERIAETNPVIRSLRDELTQKQVQLARLKVDSTEEHPTVQRLSQEIENIRKSISSAVSQSIKQETTSINPVYQSIKMELKQVERDIESLEESIHLTKILAEASLEKLREVPEKKKELEQLRREDFNSVQAYLRLLQRREEAYVTRRMELEERGTKFVILDNARVPLKPFKPNRKLILLAGFFFGLVIGGGLIVLAETTDHSFEEPNQLREFLPVPMLGATSQILTPAEKSFISAKRRLAFLSLLVIVTFVVITIVIIVLFGKGA